MSDDANSRAQQPRIREAQSERTGQNEHILAIAYFPGRRLMCVDSRYNQLQP